VLSARLADVDTEDRLGRLRGDNAGVPINGFLVDGARGSFFVGLGPPDGDAAREALEAAIRAAKA
jgi:hypothetical protein